MVNILYLELSKLTDIYSGINEAFIEKLFEEIPHIGKKHDRYYIINNSLTIYSPVQSLDIQVFNVFLQNSTRKYNLIQLLKPK